MTTKEKFTDLCYLISNDTGKHYDFWWNYLEIYENESDYNILKSKITNFVNHLNENDKDWVSKDIELEIYDMV